jgi:hypothetical protein
MGLGMDEDMYGTSLTANVYGGEFYGNGVRGIGVRENTGTVNIEAAKVYNNGNTGDQNKWVGIGVDFPTGGTRGPVNIKNCFVYENNRKGIGNDGGEIYVYFTTVADNAYYGVYRNSGSILIQSSIVWGHTDDIYGAVTVNYTDIGDGSPSGQYNISQDPQFVNPAADDYHLLLASPCIDYAKDVPGITTDYDGDTRPYDVPGRNPQWPSGTNDDMGADEYVP